MVMITPAEFEDEMKRISDSSRESTEMAHISADKLMCDVLRDNGYESGVKLFEQMNKWYS